MILSLGFTKKSHMGVVVIRAHPVQVQQRLVHTLLQLQGTFKGFRSAAPLVALWFLRQNAGQKNIRAIN